MRCLLVDDEPGIREGLAMLLRRKGHEVATAADGATAQKLLASGDYDLVITDWRLPDGTAAAFVAAANCPVFAVSGHPEEVEAAPSIRQILTKPVLPARLLELIAEVAVAASAKVAAIATEALPRDVAALVEQLQQRLGVHLQSIHDDGILVRLRGTLPEGDSLQFLAAIGGDLRTSMRGAVPEWELRLCRDGRPALDMPVVPWSAPWPAVAAFAVDFDGSEPCPAEFADCCARAAVRRRSGHQVHFLNLPPALQITARNQGNADAMPMQGTVGPRLPEFLADLWS